MISVFIPKKDKMLDEIIENGYGIVKEDITRLKEGIWAFEEQVDY